MDGRKYGRRYEWLRRSTVVLSGKSDRFIGETLLPMTRGELTLVHDYTPETLQQSSFFSPLRKGPR